MVGALLLVAALSRYEAWPACAVAGVFFGWRAVHERDRRRLVVAGLLAIVGPVLWIAWNRHAHGDAFRFFARVSAFREAVAPRSLAERALEFPVALAVQFPEAIVGAAIAVVGLRREAWRAPLVGAGAVVAFLVIGDLAGGAPTHHPERALGAVAIVATTLGVVAGVGGIL